MSDRPIRVLLDASAVVAYTQGTAIGVGEIIAEVDSEDAAVGIPIPCLVLARAEVADEAMLDLLLAHRACMLVGTVQEDWRRIAATLPLVDGRYDVAVAVVLADVLDVDILTRRPGWYVRLPGGGPIIEV